MSFPDDHTNRICWNKYHGEKNVTANIPPLISSFIFCCFDPSDEKNTRNENETDQRHQGTNYHRDNDGNDNTAYAKHTIK